MPRISDEKINEIRVKADVVNIIGQYIPLSKKGKNYVGLCPFHEDHNPSLSVSPDKQIYKCFVCHAGGNVFTFVSDFEKISFVDAVIKVAKDVNVDIGDFQQSSISVDPHVKKQQDILEQANQFLMYQLQSSDGIMIKEYLKSRGIDDHIITNFNIGYNPSNQAVSTFLLAKKHDSQTMIDVNVVTQHNEQLYDVFSERVTFPIRDDRGNLIGFTARSLFDNKSKYMNTATTDLYKKSEVVYNIHQAKEHAKRAGFILIVEGVMDVIAYHRASIKNVVSTLGTALTKQQIDTIKRASYHVVLSFDGDDAGLSATYQAIPALLEKNVVVEVVMFDGKDDPDDLLNKKGVKGLNELLENRKHWMEFMLEYGQKLYNLNNYQQKRKYIKSMIELIKKLKDTMDQKHFASVLAKITEMDLQEILQSIQQQAPPKNVKIIEKQFKKEFLVPLYEKEILSQMLLSKQATKVFSDELGYLSNNEANSLALMLVSMYRSSEEILEIADVLSKAQEKELHTFLMWLMDWPLFPKKVDLEVLSDAILHVKLKIIDEKIKEFKRLATQATNANKKAEYIDKMIEAQQEIDHLKKKEHVYETF